MNILGISAGFHDAAATVINPAGEILFAAHSERYSKIKNDANIAPALVNELYGRDIDTIAYYERPWRKQLRQWYAGQGIEWKKLTVRKILSDQLPGLVTANKKIRNYNHHLSHAAADRKSTRLNSSHSSVSRMPSSA